MSRVDELVPIALPTTLSKPPDGWRWAKLTDLARLESGHTPSRARSDWWGGDVSWISLTEIRALDGLWVEQTQIKTNAAGIANSAARILPKGTVCFSRTASVGFVTIMANPMATSQDFANWVCGEDLDPEYLMFALIRSRHELRSMATGATHKTIYMPALESFHVCFPPRDQQTKIAFRIKAMLAEANRAYHAVETQLLDVNFLKSKFLIELFSTLDCCTRVQIGDAAQVTSGTTPSRGRKDYWNPSEVPWVKTAEVNSAAIFATEECISRKALSECSLALLPPKTVLVAMYGQGKTRGQSAILEVEAATNQACFAILPNDTWTPEFLQLWLKSSYADLRALSDDRGGNQANLNGAMLKALRVPAPTKSVQMAIVERANISLLEIDRMNSAIRQSYDDLRQLPGKILAQTFSSPSEKVKASHPAAKDHLEQVLDMV